MNAPEQVQQLIEISRHYGVDSRFVIAGGGNTSYKNAEKLWVKASGSSLATITEDGFAVLDREKLKVLSERTYSSDSAEREEQVKNDLAAACISKGRRPSVETSMHNAIDYAFVIHLHPTAVNGLMCANNVESDLRRLFGEKALYIPYTDPGYVLFKFVEDSIKAYRKANGAEPQVIWLQNHGIFASVSAENMPRARPSVALNSWPINAHAASTRLSNSGLRIASQMNFWRGWLMSSPLIWNISFSTHIARRRSSCFLLLRAAM